MGWIAVEGTVDLQPRVAHESLGGTMKREYSTSRGLDKERENWRLIAYPEMILHLAGHKYNFLPCIAQRGSKRKVTYSFPLRSSPC